ncbi:MAG: universal stress protein [Desulfobacteraceae bacterium]|nr:universal stress protein [Desulfobacteraceae bacterium]
MTVQHLPKCLLLPIDGSREALRPIEFVSRLYPGLRDVNLILGYLVSPLPPAYSGMYADSADIMKRRREYLENREKETRRIFADAKEVLLKAGFAEELLHEHMEQREMSVAKHACLLADMKKVDAVLVQQTVSSALEGFLKGSSPSGLLQHCLASPIWFTDGSVDPTNAAICIFNEEASLRIADHAAFMLSETNTSITLLHASKSCDYAIVSGLEPPSAELSAWASSPEGKTAMPYLAKSSELIRDQGIDESRLRIAIIPNRGDTVGEILSWCGKSGVGIVGLGHSQPEGTWSFLKTSVTKKILSSFKNMSVWVMQ